MPIERSYVYYIMEMIQILFWRWSKSRNQTACIIWVSIFFSSIYLFKPLYKCYYVYLFHFYFLSANFFSWSSQLISLFSSSSSNFPHFILCFIFEGLIVIVGDWNPMEIIEMKKTVYQDEYKRINVVQPTKFDLRLRE